MKCQRMDKPAGARTVQRVLYGNEGIEPDLEEWVRFLFRRGGRKTVLLNPQDCELHACRDKTYILFTDKSVFSVVL